MIKSPRRLIWTNLLGEQEFTVKDQIYIIQFGYNKGFNNSLCLRLFIKFSEEFVKGAPLTSFKKYQNKYNKYKYVFDINLIKNIDQKLVLNKIVEIGEKIEKLKTFI